MNKISAKELKLNSKDIGIILKKGKRLVLKNMDVRIWWDNLIKNPLFAVSISTKVDKRATVRNRIKRLIRQAFFELTREDKIRKGKYVFIIKNREVFSKTLKEVSEEIQNGLIGI